jgi:hypothetical protein
VPVFECARIVEAEIQRSSTARSNGRGVSTHRPTPPSSSGERSASSIHPRCPHSRSRMCSSATRFTLRISDRT